MAVGYTLRMFVNDDQALADLHKVDPDEDGIGTFFYFVEKYEKTFGRDAIHQFIMIFHMVNEFINENKRNLVKDGLARETAKENVVEIPEPLVEILLASFDGAPHEVVPSSRLYGQNEKFDYSGVVKATQGYISAITKWESLHPV